MSSPVCTKDFTISIGIIPNKLNVPASGYGSPSGPGNPVGPPSFFNVTCTLILNTPTAKRWSGSMILPPSFLGQILQVDVYLNTPSNSPAQRYTVHNFEGLGIMEYDATGIASTVDPSGSYSRGNAFGFDNPLAVSGSQTIQITSI